MQITVLVTGGAGFIGSHVVDELVHLNYKVVVVDDLSGGFSENVNPKAIFHPISIQQTEEIEALFQQYNFHYLYHLAAYAAEGLSHFIRKFNYENNVIGSVNLINAAVNHNVQCFVFASSIAVYGKGKLPYKETTAPQPEDPYGIAKYSIELDLKAAREMFGLNSVLFRPHNVYGPRQNTGDKYRNVIGIFMNQLLNGKALTIFGNGEQQRAFSYIDDVAPYIARSVEIPAAYNQVFNIGGAQPYTVNQLATVTQQVMTLQSQVNYLPARNEVVNAFSDHTKFQNVFKPKVATSLPDGLTQMAAWVKQHGIKHSNEFTAIEIQKNLPETWKNNH